MGGILELANVLGQRVLQPGELCLTAKVAMALVGNEIWFEEWAEAMGCHILELSEPGILLETSQVSHSEARVYA
jgi:hypothetical protein